VYEPIKSLGQNFLSDPVVVYSMVNNLNLQNNDVVVEIGPGLGALTTELVTQLPDGDARIYAVDVDKRFVDKLTNMFVEDMTIKIVEADILDWLPSFDPGRSFKILGSLPYYITSPIIHTIIKLKIQPSICVLLIQEEVAQKICSQTGDHSYMSAIVQTFYDATLLDKVNRTKFDPEPGVDGRVIKLVKKSTSPIPVELISKYEGFLHKGFSNTRKMLNKVFTKDELALVNLDSSLRPEDVSVEKWVELFFALNKF